jgi:SAM-dependent methyltransferase
MLCSGDAWRDRLCKDGHAIRECRLCGLVQLHPLPDASLCSALYGDAYFESPAAGIGYGDYGAQEAEYLETFAEDLRRIAAFVGGGSTLDVGCGYGYFLAAAEAAGFEAWGVDLAPLAVEVARRRFPGRVFAGSPADVAELARRRFDLVFASHVIEHVADPVGFLRDLAGRVSDSGVLVLVTPNVRSLLARVSGRRWVSFKVPEHLAYYSPATIRRLAAAAGLEVMAIDPAYQHYRLAFVAKRLRELVAPLDRLVPRIEERPVLRHRMVRVTSGSMRVIARPARRTGDASSRTAGTSAPAP